MNRNYNLKLDLQFRCNNSIMKFNQFDNETSDFFIRITNGGKLFDIEKAIVVLAVIKPNKEVDSQFVEVENGVVYANLKPSMKDEIGIYTARAMLILESEKVVTDIVNYEVEEDKIFSLLNDTVVDTEKFTLLTDMLSRLSTIELNENNREEAFNNIKDEFEIIKNNHNELVTTETNNKVTELLDPVVSKANEKINEVDNKIVDIENAISEADSKINNAIAKIPPKSELIGEKGDKGEKGEKGDKGDRGEQGLQGIQGIQGIQGERGLQGIKGDKGDKGEQGIQGLKGDKGDKGDRGEQGVKGDTPSITHLETSINNKIQEVETRFNTLTSTQQQSSEVIDARDGEASLKARLDRDIEKVEQVYVELDGLQEKVSNVGSQLEQIANKGTTVEVLERVTKEEINRQIQDGTVANLTIANRSIDDEKIKINGVSLNRVKDFSINLNLIKDFNFVNKRDLNYNTGEITTSNDNRIWTSDYYLIDTSLKNKDILFGNFAEGSINTYYSVYDIDKNFIRGGFLGRTKFSDNECYFVLKVLIITPPSGYGNYLETVYDCIYFGENKVSLESKMKVAKTPYLSEIRVKEDNGLVNVWATRLDDNILLSNSNIENFLSKENYIKSNILEVGDNLFDINSAILDISQNFRNTEVVIGVAITWVNHK